MHSTFAPQSISTTPLPPFGSTEELEAYAEETFEDGTVVAAIDRQQLCRDLGIFVSPVAEEAPAEGDGGE